VKSCCEAPAPPAHRDQARVLWIALALNALMFVVEIIGSFAARSVSLRADAIDFLGDAANYGVSLLVLGQAIRVKARASVLKGLSMAGFGIWVLLSAGLHLYRGTTPEAGTMGALSFLALAVNLSVAAMLFKHRGGDSNMLSVWLCSRNDAFANLAVMAAAGLVFFLGASWPDLVVAAGLGLLALQSSFYVLRAARRELTASGPR
jgi:Co/Zn/Cd efflux system component